MSVSLRCPPPTDCVHPLGLDMGSKGVAAPSAPSPRVTPAVCCMCGDRGLPQELFRCKLCLVRCQHNYCSNLYPRAESYRACNWCLKQEAASTTLTVADDNSSPRMHSPAGTIDSSAVKMSRGVFRSQHLNKAVKKHKVMQEGPSSPRPHKVKIDRPSPMRSEEVSPSAGRGKQAFRGKARRYKLLEDVSS